MHVLITAGPTREYLDDVRFLSNASSGRMGYALADAALRRGWRVTLVSGPVSLAPPIGADVVSVVSAQDMLEACLRSLSQVDGVIAVAAVADYRPHSRIAGKFHRTSDPLHVELVPNPDILAELGRRKTRQWTVGFAVESDELVNRARAKLAAKNCDAIVANHASAMESDETSIQIIDAHGAVSDSFRGEKTAAAERIVHWIEQNLVTA